MNILDFIIALPVLGILVFVHEFGHFIMAKINGIGVDTFSIGFGKELIGFNIGETHYRIAIIPFGGYCKMRGEESKDRETGAVNDTRAMYNRPALSRLATVLGGPVFNYIFAVIVMAFVLLAGYKETLITSQVAVIEKDASGKPTPAQLSGLRSGDTILSIGGSKIESYNDIPRVIGLSMDKEMEITFLRNNATNQSKIEPRFNKEKGMNYIGVTPFYYNTVGSVTSNSPAFTAGIQPGDEITGLDGKKIAHYYEIEKYIENKTNQYVAVTFSNTNNTVTKKILLSRFEGKGYLGVNPANKFPTFSRTTKSQGPLTALKDGFYQANEFLVETLKGLGVLIFGKMDVQKSIAGPVRILQITGEIATKTDFSTLLRFMALISVALGFFNLLPIPGFDGGHAILSIMEFITRKKLPEKVRMIIEMVGLVCIIILAVFVTYNDIFNMFLGR